MERFKIILFYYTTCYKIGILEFVDSLRNTSTNKIKYKYMKVINTGNQLNELNKHINNYVVKRLFNLNL